MNIVYNPKRIPPYNNHYLQFDNLKLGNVKSWFNINRTGIGQSSVRENFERPVGKK